MMGRQEREGESRGSDAPGESHVESPGVSEETDALLYVRAYGRHDDEVLLSALWVWSKAVRACESGEYKRDGYSVISL